MNKAIYFFIDDERSNRTTAASLKGENLDVVFHLLEDNWEKQLTFLLNSSDQLDGLLLDWQLQGEETGNNGYDAEALAQQIRRLASENKLEKDFPIILCSAADNYKEVFSKDLTGHDLFDLTFMKSDFGEDEKIPKIRKRFFALAKGYAVLQNERLNVNSALGKNPFFVVEPRLASVLKKKLDEGVPHEIARFIIDEILQKNGILVNEEILAVRLGVDLKESSGWNSLLEILKESRYEGVFSFGWNRWWMSDIEKWWNNKFPNISLRRTPAHEKAKLLREKLDSSLEHIKYHSDKHKSSFYWITCAETKVPIDTTDGLILDGQENLYPWQEKEYVSIEAATNPNIEMSTAVAAFEESRLKNLKDKFSVQRRKRR